ncbi:hypothetical protein RAS1_05480 [Phycisphaerae bacterium RAS1]|nr:hypothetical protein RAS1_05480 [Phycisphaerae bacterium RAS1]
MPPRIEWKPTQCLPYAQVSCLTLGIAMLIWGLAPAIIERVVTQRAPSLEGLAMGSMTFLIGTTFLGMALLIGARMRWALLAANYLAVALVTITVIAAMITPPKIVALFVLVLACNTVIATWLALRAATAAPASSSPFAVFIPGAAVSAAHAARTAQARQAEPGEERAEPGTTDQKPSGFVASAEERVAPAAHSPRAAAEPLIETHST